MHSVTLLHVSALNGPSTGSTDTFCEQGQQNACPDVNIRLKSSALYGTWQLSNCMVDVNIYIYSALVGFLRKIVPYRSWMDGNRKPEDKRKKKFYFMDFMHGSCPSCLPKGGFQS